MAEGATSSLLDGGSLNFICEAVRVGVDFLQGGEDVRFALNLHHLFSIMIQDPNVVRVWDGRWWPIDDVAVKRGWAGGHACCCREYLWGKKRGVNKVILDTNRRRRQ